MGMNEGERAAYERLRFMGWTAAHTGAPDFILYREDPKPRIAFCEVKRAGARLLLGQEAWRRAIQGAGLPYYLAVVDTTGRVRIAEAPKGVSSVPLTAVRPGTPYGCVDRRCGYRWLARVSVPLRCPKCGRRTARDRSDVAGVPA